ncbi:exported protein [Caldovatus sediminis]|uniref:Exported protein n=1 Tax=Caldovatus sediminis TaxID=2041189 RepID=A0A8J2ZBR6_9PROT|nr:tripartite tricarboxylate transporter substrate binding protein [Caldovatus sediminis]GGG34341.1 exported protein [Caldovatus sediminis]
MAQRLSERLGQQFVVDNRPGASGVIGSEHVARSRPDGYTLLMVFPSHPVNPSLKRSLPYDTERDFAPVTMVTMVTPVLVVPPDLPARNVSELVALARRERLNFASVGVGSLGHLTAELFRISAGIELVHIPFRSVPDAQTALLRREVAMFFDTPSTAVPMVGDGRLRALAVGTARRSPAMPEVPTLAESGVPDFDVFGWNGILAPAGTPRPIIGRLNAAIHAVLREPEVARQLAEQGAEPAPNSPEEFAARISADIAKWARAVREAGIRPG